MPRLPHSSYLPWLGYFASIAFVAGGALAAAADYPNGFDWAYEVMSALASAKHNPHGGHWFAGGLAVGMLALWPAKQAIVKDHHPNSALEGFGSAALTVGILCGAAVGLERLFVYHLSDLIDKAHEVLALLSFLGLYLGMLSLTVARARKQPTFRWTALLVATPLLAIGLSQLALYLDQRDLGWVDPSWREMGIPLWKSFAFWQWLAAGSIWLGLGALLPRPSSAKR